MVDFLLNLSVVKGHSINKWNFLNFNIKKKIIKTFLRLWNIYKIRDDNVIKPYLAIRADNLLLQSLNKEY